MVTHCNCAQIWHCMETWKKFFIKITMHLQILGCHFIVNIMIEILFIMNHDRNVVNCFLLNFKAILRPECMGTALMLLGVDSCRSMTYLYITQASTMGNCLFQSFQYANKMLHYQTSLIKNMEIILKTECLSKEKILCMLPC